MRLIVRFVFTSLVALSGCSGAKTGQAPAAGATGSSSAASKAAAVDAGAVVCGKTICAPSEVCCNASCGICAPPDGVCTQQLCD